MFGRISFFVNAGVRFIEEHAKLRAMAQLWDELGRERYGVEDDKQRRFRYGVQVNSLGLTEAQPENNVYRIALEALAVTLGRDARARAIQLPAWNEALGLPRPWDQQWSLRLQQILAYETDLLEYPDIFEGSRVMDGLVAELVDGAREEMARVAELGGAVDAVDYMKAALVESHRERWRRIEAGEQTVVGHEPLHDDRALAADGRRRRRHPRRRSGGRGASSARRSSSGARSATRPPSTTRSPSCAGWPATSARTSCPRRSPPRAPAPPPASGPRRCARCSASTARPPASARRAAGASEEIAELREEVDRVSEASAAGSSSWSASPASTATPTAPSRSPCARAMRAWTSSTRASG